MQLNRINNQLLNQSQTHMNSLYFKTLGQPEYREDYAQQQNDQSFEDLQDKFSKTALFKLKKEHHLNTINIPEPVPTV